MEKKTRQEIDLKIFMLKKYYDLLDLFFKKNLNIFLFYQNNNYKIILKKRLKT